MSLIVSRTVRFGVSLDPASAEQPAGGSNSFAGWPSHPGIAAYFELEVACRGEPDPTTGYMLNISAIDKAVREHALPVVFDAVRRHPASHPGAVLAQIWPLLQAALKRTIASIRWNLSPYYSVTMADDAPQRVLMRQSFEFSASHRLNVASMPAERNREVFGKCNNGNGHGHNYRIEPAVLVSLNSASSRLTLPELERIVDRTVIQRFDHKHLNLDTVEFTQLNPSVENIARVCYDLLRGPVAEAGGELRCVTVWETEKTRCTYPA